MKVCHNDLQVLWYFQSMNKVTMSNVLAALNTKSFRECYKVSVLLVATVMPLTCGNDER